MSSILNETHLKTMIGLLYDTTKYSNFDLFVNLALKRWRKMGVYQTNSLDLSKVSSGIEFEKRYPLYADVVRKTMESDDFIEDFVSEVFSMNYPNIARMIEASDIKKLHIAAMNHDDLLKTDLRKHLQTLKKAIEKKSKESEESLEAILEDKPKSSKKRKKVKKTEVIHQDILPSKLEEQINITNQDILPSKQEFEIEKRNDCSINNIQKEESEMQTNNLEDSKSHSEAKCSFSDQVENSLNNKDSDEKLRLILEFQSSERKDILKAIQDIQKSIDNNAKILQEAFNESAKILQEALRENAKVIQEALRENTKILQEALNENTQVIQRLLEEQKQSRDEQKLFMQQVIETMKSNRTQ